MRHANMLNECRDVTLAKKHCDILNMNMSFFS